MNPHLVIGILRGTPVWVFILFAYLLSTGLKQLGPTVRDRRRVWLVPLLFIAWGLIGLFGRSAPASEIALCWLGGAGVGALIAGQLDITVKIDHLQGRIWQPGSVVPLLRNMSIFLSHYLLRVGAAVRPEMGGQLTACDIVVSGLSAGYFIAWAIRFAQACRNAPEADLGNAAVCSAVAAR